MGMSKGTSNNIKKLKHIKQILKSMNEDFEMDFRF